MVKLGRTDSANLVTVRIFGGTEMQLGRTDMVRVRAYRNLGETDYTNLVRPILVIRKELFQELKVSPENKSFNFLAKF